MIDTAYIRRLSRAQKTPLQRSPQGVFDGWDDSGKIILRTAGGGKAYLSDPNPVARYQGVPVNRTGRLAI